MIFSFIFLCFLIGQISNVDCHSVQQKGGKLGCDLCQFFLFAAKKFVTNPFVESVYDNLFLKLCNIFPTQNQENVYQNSKCEKFMNGTVLGNLHQFLSNWNVLTTCSLLELCQTRSELQYFSQNNDMRLNYDDRNKSLGYMLQIVVHLTAIEKTASCSMDPEIISHALRLSAAISNSIHRFRSNGDEINPNGRTFNDLCFQVEDRAVTENENEETIQNVLPTFSCLLLAPSLLLDNERGVLRFQDYSSIFSRIRLLASGNLRDLLFGLPWKMTGFSRYHVCSRKRNIAFAMTLVFRHYEPDFVSELREYLTKQFENLNEVDNFVPANSSHFENDNKNIISLINSTTSSSTNDDVPNTSKTIVDAIDVNHIKIKTTSSNFSNNDVHLNQDMQQKSIDGYIFLVWYRDRSYLFDYAPLLSIYIILLLYIYFSVRKLEMVKSKWGLALSACVTVAASLFMSMGLCVTIGLMVPTLNGSEIFPYLVMLIGFENVIVLTKSVVSTSVDLPVKYRIAEGLSKESWSITKLYLTGLLLFGLGFLTFHPTMQEFCLFAVVGLTTDFFLQLFFFVTILSVDVRRMELSDLFSDGRFNSFLQTSEFHSSSSSHLSDVPVSTYSSSSLSTPVNINYNYCKIESDINQPNSLKSDRFLINILCSVLNLGYIKISQSVFGIFSLLRKPSTQFVRGHKRKVSAAQTAAYLASDGVTTENVPRRLRVLRSWAKLRFFQRFLLISVAVWITVFTIYTIDLYQILLRLKFYLRISDKEHSDNIVILNSQSKTDVNDHDWVVNDAESMDRSGKSSSPNSDETLVDNSHLRFHNTAIKESLILNESNNITINHNHNDEENDTDEYENDSLNGESNNNNNKSKNNNHITYLDKQFYKRSNSSFVWDTMLMWNYLAFYHWPLLAKHYNLSLAGCHLALLEPIHLKQLTQYVNIEKSNTQNDIHYSSYLSSETEKKGFLFSFQSGTRDEVLGSRTKSSLIPALEISPGGFASWTARVGLTATMLITSVLGCSFILIITCLGMICLQSKFSCPHKYEPVVRVLPLTINLMSDPSNNSTKFDGEHHNPIITPEWTITCGHLVYKDNKGILCSWALIAVTSVRSFSKTKSNYSAIIQLWCADSGSPLSDLIRYSDESKNLRQTVDSNGKIICRRFSTVWCMSFMPQKYLLVGCSDGSIEIWDCEKSQLIHIVLLNLASKSVCSENELESSTVKSNYSHQLHPGGITTLRIIDDTRFCAGTSRGHVAYIYLDLKCLKTNYSSPMCQWHFHSKPVTQLQCMRLMKFSPTTSSDDVNGELSNDVDSLIISGAEDGHVTFYSANMDDQIADWNIDPTPVISSALNKLVLAISHASGSLYVTSLELRGSTKFENSLNVTLIKEVCISSQVILNHNSNIDVDKHLNSSTQFNKSRKYVKNLRPGSTDLLLFLNCDVYKTNLSSSSLSSALDNYRLVSHDLDGMITIWNIKQRSIVRSFKSNLSTFNLSNTLLAIQKRAVFGDQGYLRVVNPWTAKYERSVQLLPPSSVSLRGTNGLPSSRLSTLLRLWTKEFVPLGVAGSSLETQFPDVLYVPNSQNAESCIFLPSNRNAQLSNRICYVISLADGGQTLVVVPLSALKIDQND